MVQIYTALVKNFWPRILAESVTSCEVVLTEQCFNFYCNYVADFNRSCEEFLTEDFARDCVQLWSSVCPNLRNTSVKKRSAEHFGREFLYFGDRKYGILLT